MKIMTEEYCRQCPFFNPNLGYLEEDDPYWQTLPDNRCVCKTCPKREQCERDGPPDDISFCIETVLDMIPPERFREFAYATFPELEVQND